MTAFQDSECRANIPIGGYSNDFKRDLLLDIITDSRKAQDGISRLAHRLIRFWQWGFEPGLAEVVYSDPMSIDLKLAFHNLQPSAAASVLVKMPLQLNRKLNHRPCSCRMPTPPS